MPAYQIGGGLFSFTDRCFACALLFGLSLTALQPKKSWLLPIVQARLGTNGRQGFPLRWRCLWIERDGHPSRLLFRPPPVADVAGQPILGIRQIHVPRMPFAHSHRHVEFTHGMFRMLVEIALAK